MSMGTILVVEDNPITRKMMRFALESEGYRVVEAGEGHAALTLARDQRPDLVLQDYVLPDMDGLQLIEGLRRLPALAATPIVVVTGMVSRLDELQARGLPNTIFLPKPIEPSRLLEVVRAHVTPFTRASPAGRRVLVVDDDPLNLRLASLRLRDSGFEVQTAAGGEEALAAMRASLPDAILADVLMPGMDGFLLCDIVRRDPALAHVPLVLLSSAYVDEADQALAREMGANALLLRTPDLGTAAAALTRAFATGAGSPAPGMTRNRDALHKERVQIQLDRQLARNEALLRQGAIQTAALSVVRGLAEALAKPRDLASVLGDVLVHCLDATGLSTGLLYVVTSDGPLELRAQAGLPAEARLEAARCFGEPEVLRRALDGGDPVAFSLDGAGGGDRGLRMIAERLGRTSILVIPFVVGDERVGLLLLAADSQDFSDGTWLAFASTLARQFGQTIAVGQSLFRGAASEARYRTLLEHAHDAILLVDDGRVVEANRQAETLLGRPRPAIVGHHYGEFVAAGPRPAAFFAAEGTTTTTQDQLLVRGDGSTVAADVSASAVRVGEDTIVLLVLRDITERKRAEKRLRESETQYRLLFDGNPHPMWVYDPGSLAFLAVNDAAVELYGYTREEFLTMTLADIRPESDVPSLLARLARPEDHGRSSDGVWRHRLKNGTVLDVEISSNSIAFRGRTARLVLASDVSEKRRLETQLRQAQKMEAVGRLAGGVAHDFNNLLGVIAGYGELLRKGLGPGHVELRRVTEIQKAAGRAADLTRQLLAFSRKQVLETKVLSLNDVVTDLGGMLHRLIGEDMHLVTRVTPDAGNVRADRGQLEQVIVNLVVNARDAMPTGGELVLETASALLDGEDARIGDGLRPGPYAVLTVADTGTGMDGETQSHIFEPFFTTKGEGKGTGLGLATVFGIVQQSGGHVTVESEIGKGSTFRVYLPRTDEEGSPAVTGGAPAEVMGNETVLLVEDAEALRAMIREILENGGYSVVEYASAGAVLDEIGKLRRIDVLLTDVVMPKMGGPELARHVRRTHPEVKIVFMSGYTDHAIAAHHDTTDAAGFFLQKPFTTEDLLTKVRAALDSPRG
jgi:two-component system cell cycle sensor histidine kinase/response regulator CckA